MTTDTQLLQRSVMSPSDATAFFAYSPPDETFWNDYDELWENSLYRPAFQSPQYIRYLADKFKGSLVIYQFYLDGKLKGAAFFNKKGTRYGMLTDVKADHNFFVVHKDCGTDEIAAFFNGFLTEMKKENWALSLKLQPSWASYLDVFSKLAQENGLFWSASAQSTCLMVEEETPEKLYESVSSSRDIRYKRNKIKNHLSAEYEILFGDEDLDAWTERFCELHEKRWRNTHSPSRYADEAGRKFLKECMSAWVRDKILVRFAIKAEDKRISLVIGLRQQNAIIYHAPAYDDGYDKYSPGKVLILHMGEWMKENGYNVLDFGTGGESYKYAFANKELTLDQISICSSRNIPFILKVKIKQTLQQNIRNNPVLKKLYQEKIMPLARRMNALKGIAPQIALQDIFLNPDLLIFNL